MDITCVQKQTYEICCDAQGYCAGCTVITTSDIYGDRKYMSTSMAAKPISLEKMKKIVEELKQA